MIFPVIMVPSALFGDLNMCIRYVFVFVSYSVFLCITVLSTPNFL